MLQLTPLDQTTAGKQIYERGFKQGLILKFADLLQALAVLTRPR